MWSLCVVKYQLCGSNCGKKDGAVNLFGGHRSVVISTPMSCYQSGQVAIDYYMILIDMCGTNVTIFTVQSTLRHYERHQGNQV